MRAEMDERGCITLTPESTVEAYALRQWIREAEVTSYRDVPGMPSRQPESNWSFSMLIVDTNVKEN